MKRFLLLVLATFLVSPAFSETASERAGALKTWREQCNDPDPDLRLAYIEDAITSGDVSIQRICIRLALESDNADVQNLGLRAALASKSQIVFDVDMPPELKAAIDAARGNRDKLAEIDRWYIFKDYQQIKNGLVFEIRNASAPSGQSEWYPLGSRSSAHDNFKGRAVVTGRRLHWTGDASLDRSWSCKLDVALMAGAKLGGKFSCDKLWSFPVTASLL